MVVGVEAHVHARVVVIVVADLIVADLIVATLVEEAVAEEISVEMTPAIESMETEIRADVILVDEILVADAAAAVHAVVDDIQDVAHHVDVIHAKLRKVATRVSVSRLRVATWY